MYIFNKAFKYENPNGNNFIAIPMKMYSEREVPVFVKKSKQLKEQIDAGLVSGGEKEVNKLDPSLIAEAKRLGINFDDSIQQSVLEATVKRVQEANKDNEKTETTVVVPPVEKTTEGNENIEDDDAKRALIGLLLPAGVKANMTWGLAKLQAKAEELELVTKVEEE